MKLQDALGAAGGVSLVSPPQINDDGNAAVYSVIATTAPSDPETADLVEELRSTTIPEATAGEDVQAYVGGSTASNVDLAAEITSRLPLVIIVVLAAQHHRADHRVPLAAGAAAGRGDQRALRRAPPSGS